MPKLLNDLPQELLLRILKYLPTPTLGRLAQVSKQWNALSEDEGL